MPPRPFLRPFLKTKFYIDLFFQNIDRLTFLSYSSYCTIIPSWILSNDLYSLPSILFLANKICTKASSKSKTLLNLVKKWFRNFRKTFSTPRWSLCGKKKIEKKNSKKRPKFFLEQKKKNRKKKTLKSDQNFFVKKNKN